MNTYDTLIHAAELIDDGRHEFSCNAVAQAEDLIVSVERRYRDFYRGQRKDLNGTLVCRIFQMHGLDPLVREAEVPVAARDAMRAHRVFMLLFAAEFFADEDGDEYEFTDDLST